MVRWMRSGRIAGGKEQQAMKWTKEFLEWTNKKYGSGLSAYIDSFGELGTIRFFRDYESLADVEKRMATILSDQEYWQWAGRAAEFIIEGSVVDTVMRSL